MNAYTNDGCGSASSDSWRWEGGGFGLQEADGIRGDQKGHRPAPPGVSVASCL